MLRSFLAICCYILVSLNAQAQEPIVEARPLKGKVNDHFDKTAKAAGGRLVGLSFSGNVIEKFNPLDVRIAMPLVRKPVICVRGISRDGLYWTRTPYVSPAETSDTHEVRLFPFTFVYGSQLRTYGRSDVALLIFEATDANCFDEGAQMMPVLSRSSKELEIVAHVNTGNQHVEMALQIGDKLVPGVCGQVLNREKIAFDIDCTVPVALLAEPVSATLVLTFDDGLAVEKKPYTVFLPPKRQ